PASGSPPATVITPTTAPAAPSRLSPASCAPATGVTVRIRAVTISAPIKAAPTVAGAGHSAQVATDHAATPPHNAATASASWAIRGIFCRSVHQAATPSKPATLIAVTSGPAACG